MPAKEEINTKCPQEMVQTVVSQLFARYSRPDKSDCEKVARQMILKYPFTKDDKGSGYVSLLCFCGGWKLAKTCKSINV